LLFRKLGVQDQGASKFSYWWGFVLVLVLLGFYNLKNPQWFINNQNYFSQLCRMGHLRADLGFGESLLPDSQKADFLQCPHDRRYKETLCGFLTKGINPNPGLHPHD
jgi:hypothetical protein